VLPAMIFNEVGERPLFSSERLHTVYIYTSINCASVNEFCLRLKRRVGLP
jgi:hypothetical protein